MKREDKTTLVQAIQTLLQNENLRTQADITNALYQKGYKVNQVMVSRVLTQLGAIKVNEGAQTVYRLPHEPIHVSNRDTLKQLILNITHNQAMIVVKTTPGSAQLVARLVDQKNNFDLLGTVAGDDCIFIAPKDIKSINTLFKKIVAELLA